jgi:hypothetical protein
MAMPKSFFFLCRLVFLALAAGGASAAYAGGEKWALLIGVDKCEAVGELTVCVNDARAMKSMLERIGYPAQHITLLVDNQSNMTAMPTLLNVERAIKRLAKAAAADDKIFFFFSGHGFTYNGDSFLVPTDGDLNRGVSLALIMDQFAACKAKEKVMILDACHSGASKGVSGITPDLKTSGNLVMLLSCEKDQVSWPDKQKQQSVFTSALLDGLSGKAANDDRKVTHLTLADYVSKYVKDWTYENQKSEQNPMLVADVSSDIVLADLTKMISINVQDKGLVPIKPPVAGNNGNGNDGQKPPPETQKGPRKGEAWASPATGMEFVWVPDLKLWAGKYETTNGEYRKKESEHDSEEYKGNSLNGDRQPVVYVDFNDAVDYAAWLTEQDKDRLGGMRYRVPSEAEWQTFAQCGDGREYPWGNTMPPKFGNYADKVSPCLGKIEGYVDGFPVTCPVEKSGENSWGLYGVGGNVYEFCSTDVSGTSCGARRGASWAGGAPDSLRCTARFDGGGGGSFLVGVRLVLSGEGLKGDGKSDRSENQSRGFLSRLSGWF